MTLPDEFVSLFNMLLTSAKEKPKEFQLLSKTQFDYTHERDFVYGQRTGWFLGMLLGWWVGKFGDRPNEEDFMEIIDMFQDHINEIKRSLSKLKD